MSWIREVLRMQEAGVPQEIRPLAIQMAKDAGHAGESMKVEIVFDEEDLAKHPRIKR